MRRAPYEKDEFGQIRVSVLEKARGEEIKMGEVG
jgi:hypothetical protein